MESSIKPRKIKKPPRKIYLYAKANSDKIKEEINNINLNKQHNDKDIDIDQLWNLFKTEVTNIMDNHIPTKMINNSKRKQPWINKKIKSLIRKRNKMFKSMKQHPNSKTTQKYKEIKHQIQRETRNAYWNYIENIICYDETVETSQKQKKF